MINLYTIFFKATSVSQRLNISWMMFKGSTLDIHRLYIYIWGLIFYSYMKKPLHDRIISLRVKHWGDKTNLTPPRFIEIPVRSHKNRRWCICVLEVSILPLSMVFLFGFWNCSNSVVLYFILAPTLKRLITIVP